MREGLCLREGIKDQSQMLLRRALDLQEIKKVEKVRQRLCLKWESRGSEAYNHPRCSGGNYSACQNHTTVAQGASIIQSLGEQKL